MTQARPAREKYQKLLLKLSAKRGYKPALFKFGATCGHLQENRTLLKVKPMQQ